MCIRDRSSALVRTLPLALLPPGYRVWFDLSDNLLLAFAVLRLLLWLGLELPAVAGWWRSPPDLLLQLLMLGGGGFATVAVLKQSASLDLVGLVTTSAVLTAVVGLAAQESLKDLFAGLELQLGNEFSVGDWVELEGGPRGFVESITWRDTCLRNVDDNLLLVPNSQITAKVLTNLGAFGAVSNRFSIGLDYNFPPARALGLLRRTVSQHPLVLGEPAPLVRIRAYGESAIDYEIQVWQREKGDRALWSLRSDLLEQIWYALQREGQSVPYPVRELRRRREVDPAEQVREPTPQECCLALARDGIFSQLSPEQLLQLVQESRLIAYGPGEAIVEEGAEGESVYHVLRGEVEVIKRLENGALVSVARLGAGQLFGEMTLFLDAPRSATVRALDECLLLRVARSSIRGLLESHPALLESFAELVSARQAELANLDRGQRTEQTNALLQSMRKLFFAFTGS